MFWSSLINNLNFKHPVNYGRPCLIDVTVYSVARLYLLLPETEKKIVENTYSS